MTSSSRAMTFVGIFLSIAAIAAAENTAPYFVEQPAVLLNQTLQSSASTWQSVMQEITWWPNTFLFIETSTLTVNLQCNVGGTGPFTCTWYSYNGTLSLSSSYQQLTTYTMSTYNGGTNCQLTVPVTAVALNFSFFCSASSTATNIPAVSDTVAFIANPTPSTLSKSLPALKTYQYTYLQNSAASNVLYPLLNSWYMKKTTACQGAVCTSTFDPTRFITDEQGSVHMIALQASDVQFGNNVVCDSRLNSGYLQVTSWTTSYSPTTIDTTGTASTSTTATLKYVSGAGQVSTTTATGTVRAYEGQLVLPLACIYTNKATAVQVYWALNGTSLGNYTSGAYVVQQVALSSGGTYTCYEAATPSAVSTINLVVIPRLRWLKPKKMAYLVLGTPNAYIDASNSIGPTTITYTWSVNAQQITASSAQAGWTLSSNAVITHAAAPQSSDQTVVQLRLLSGSQMRNYAISVLVVNSMSLGASPFSSNLMYVSLNGSGSTVTASGTGDSRVNNGQLSFAWIFDQIPLSQISTSTQCNVSSNDTNYWPSMYVVLWNNGSVPNNTNVSLPALSFAQGSNSASMTWNAPIASSDRDKYRGCYCVKAYNDAEARFQCGVVVFAGDAVAGAAVAVAGFPWWAILLLVVISILILLCCFCCVFLICCWWRRRQRKGVYKVEKREIQEGNNPVQELHESGFRPQEPGVKHPLDPNAEPQEEEEEREPEPNANDEEPLTQTVAAPVVRSARPPSMNGSQPPSQPIYGDRTYVAAGSIPPPNGVTYHVNLPPPPPSRLSNFSNVDGRDPPRPGNSYGYPPVPPPRPSSPQPPFVRTPGIVIQSPPSPRATLTYSVTPTQPAFTQPMPAVQFYSSTQPPPLVHTPRRIDNRDTLI